MKRHWFIRVGQTLAMLLCVCEARLEAAEQSSATFRVTADVTDSAALERAFAGGLTFRVGTCSVPEELPALFPLVQSGRLKPERYISHRLPLSQGADAYSLFDRREAGALKMVLVP